MTRLTEISGGLLLGAALTLTQLLIGGTRPIFSLPGYALLTLIGVVAIISFLSAKPLPSNLCLVSAALFFGYVLVRAFLSPIEYLARPDIYSVLGALSIYLFVACTFVETKWRMWLVGWLLLVAMAHVVIGAIQFRDGTNFMPISFLQRFDYGRRASGFYVNPNHLAGLLEILGIFAVSLASWSRLRTWTKLLLLYTAAVCYAGLILTGSRGGYVSAVVSLIVFVLLSLIVLWKAGSSVFTRIAGATLVLAAVVGVTVFVLIRGSLFVTERTEKGLDAPGYNRRYDLWEAAVRQWQVQPVLGTGSGTHLFYGRQFRNETTNKDPVYAHNDYLQLLAEYGLVGGLAFLAFLGTHLLQGWRNFQRLGPKRVRVSTRLFSNALALQLGALGAIAAYMVHSVVDFNLHIPANALLMAFVFGLVANPGIATESKLPAVTPPLIAWRFALAAIAVTLGVLCAKSFKPDYFAERARVALRDNDPTTSAKFAIQALASDQKNPNLYYYLGRAGILEGNAATDPAKRVYLFNVGMVAFEKGWALTPQDRIFPQELASIYDALGRFPEGEWMYDEALRLDPLDQELRQSYAAHLDRWRKSGETTETNATSE